MAGAFDWLAGGWDAFKAWTADPNNQKMMADMGSNFSQGQNFGQAVGDSVQQTITDKQVQAAAAKQSAANKGMMEQFISMLQGNGGDMVVSDGSDLSKPNSFSATGDTISLNIPNQTNSTESMSFASTQKRLNEMMKPYNPYQAMLGE